MSSVAVNKIIERDIAWQIFNTLKSNHSGRAEGEDKGHILVKEEEVTVKLGRMTNSNKLILLGLWSGLPPI